MKKFNKLFGWAFIVIFSIDSIISFAIAFNNLMQYKNITSTVAYNTFIATICAGLAVLTYKQLINETND